MSLVQRYLLLAFVLVVLVLQACVVLSQVLFHGGGGLPATRYWPIMSYAMYSKKRNEGDFVNAFYPIQVVLRSGEVVSLDEESLGLKHWFYINLGKSLLNEIGVEDSIDIIKSKYSKGDQVVEVRVLTYPAIVTKSGYEPASSKILKSYVVGEFGQNSAPGTDK